MHKNFLIFVQNIIVLLGNTHQLKTRKKKRMQNAAAHLQKSLFVPCNEGEGKQILSQLLWTGATHATPPLSQSPGG